MPPRSACGKRMLTLDHSPPAPTHACDFWVLDRKAAGNGANPAVNPGFNPGCKHIDTGTLWLVKHPEDWDFIAAPNPFGDIMTDLTDTIQPWATSAAQDKFP
jgi:hypothetical protein